jgi:hypothetical protein
MIVAPTKNVKGFGFLALPTIPSNRKNYSSTLFGQLMFEESRVRT